VEMNPSDVGNNDRYVVQVGVRLAGSEGVGMLLWDGRLRTL
jgi:hypothetical protein